ncbi:MAG TPA: hypothetical protein VGF67_09665 [Ktedonobacteraceae bacterium]
MSVLDVVENWLSPITDPLKELPGHLDMMQQTHLNSLADFQSFMSDITVNAPPGEQWTGISAEEAAQWVQEYMACEQALSAPGATLDLVAVATNTAVSDVEVASETLAAAVADDTVITEVTAAVDVADVAQAGLDPVTDLAGLILTIVDIALYFSALAAFGWAIYQATQTLINALNQAGNQPRPKLPGQPVALSQTAQKLAREYRQQGIDVDPQDIQDMLDRGYTPDEIDQIIKNLQKLYGKAGTRGALHTLLILGFTSAQAVAITNMMMQLNDPQSTPASSYLKGKPGDDIYADILAAMIMQSAQDATAQLSTLQSAIQKARYKKGARLTPDEIIAAVESTGSSWKNLPADVQLFLLGKGRPNFAYGNAVEALVKKGLQNEYPAAYDDYVKRLGLEIEPYTPLPDGTWQYPDFTFTDPATGQTVVEDLTSKGNMPTKTKYDPISDILIAIGYGK